MITIIIVIIAIIDYR